MLIHGVKNNSTDCNFFSQMVWANTEKVGCAIEYCDIGESSGGLMPIMSCHYFPAGNIHPQKATPTCTAAPMDPVPPPTPIPEPVFEPAFELPGSNPPEVPETDDCTDEVTPKWKSRVKSCAEAIASRWCDAIFPACGVSCKLCRIKPGTIQAQPPPPPQVQTPAITECDDQPIHEGVMYDVKCELNSPWCAAFPGDDFCRMSCGKCGLAAAAQQATTTTEGTADNTADTTTDTVSDSTSTDSSMPGWAIGLIVLGSIMVLLLIVIVLLVLRR